ncbi:carbon-nitrogen hydrolase family protein [Candidatus Sumerlaeota bacterium]|nr:carbon-nitrogen hydrolase family protein [Candidatus Sumerlaeota bacterium]
MDASTTRALDGILLELRRKLDAETADAGDEEKTPNSVEEIEGAVGADGEELAAIRAESAKLGLFTYLGMVERSPSGGSVYCTLAAIDPERGVLSLHRKLVPTHAERMVWSPGDGHGLAVHDWKGFRVGGLNCWENWMPLARFALYAQGEHLHVATWPGAPYLTRDISRFIALEGRVYVISAGGVLRGEHIPDGFVLKKEMLAGRDRLLSGGTIIVAPDGKVIAGPVKDEETILYAEVDLETVLKERQSFDPAGHYHRPDVFTLQVNRARLEPFEQRTE